MELGATICSPSAPQCLLCPLCSLCRARAQGLTDRIPPPRRRAAVKAIDMVVAAVTCSGSLLFTQRPPRGLWAGLWELPNEPLAGKEDHATARDRLLARLPIACEVEPTPLPPVTRTLTHRRITFHIYRATASPAAPAGPARVTAAPRGDRTPITAPAPAGRTPTPTTPANTYRWLTPQDLPAIGLSRACQAILEQIRFFDR